MGRSRRIARWRLIPIRATLATVHSPFAALPMLPLLLFAAAIGVVAPLYARARSLDPSRIFFNWYGVFLVAGTTIVWNEPPGT
jgi:hypothetical protein